MLSRRSHRSWGPALAGPTVTSFVLTCALILLCAKRDLLSHETLTTTVLFDREVVRILDRHCVMCHTEGGPSFPLETYEQTWVQGRKIRSDAIARHMPPWAAFPGYGRFVNDNSLTLRESQFIVSWVEGLGPRNAGKVFLNVQDQTAPRPSAVRAHVDFDRWQLGMPSLSRMLPATTIEPMESDSVKHITVDTGLESDRWLRAFEFRPGDRRVLRAAFFRLQETGQWLGSWTPWYGFVAAPSGAASRLPAGSHIVAELHYRGAKDRVVDRGTIGLFFADQAPASIVSDVVLDAKGEIAGGAQAQKFKAVTRIGADTRALALLPEVERGVTSVEISARRPDGSKDVLLFAKDLPLDWPTPYIFKEPVMLRAGTELSATAYYANGGSSPRTGGIRLTISRMRPRTN